MSMIEVVCDGFSGSFAKVNGSRTITVSRLRMIREIATIGMQSFRVLDWPIRISRILNAIAMCLYLEEPSEGLFLSANFNKIDSSEKGIASYWLGMGFAKIVADAVLEVPCLQNVDNLVRQGTVRIAPQSKRRGDLVGLSKQGDWHAIEAKGRSRSHAFKGNHQEVNHAKQQSLKILSVSGKSPITNSACLTALRTRPISVLLYDPPPDDGEYLETTADNFYRRYYEGVIEVINFFNPKVETIGQHDFRVATIPIPIALEPGPSLLEWKLGLLAKIFDSPELAGELVGKPGFVNDDFVGNDGILLEPGREWFNLDRAEDLK